MQRAFQLLYTTVLAALTVPALAQGTSPQQKLAYPMARKGNAIDTYFGTRVPAPYQWMENLTDPRLRQWVKAENALTNAYLAKIPVRGWIDHRLTELWNYSREHTPYQLGNGTLFYHRNSGMQNQSVVYVQDSPTAKPRVLLDPNKLSPDGSIALGGDRPSPNGRYLAYALSRGARTGRRSTC